MEAVAYSTFRNGLRGYMDKVRDDAEPVLVTSKDPESNIVVLNIREYENIRENLYILSNKDLVRKIERGLEQVRADKCQTHDLIEADDE